GDRVAKKAFGLFSRSSRLSATESRSLKNPFDHVRFKTPGDGVCGRRPKRLARGTGARHPIYLETPQRCRYSFWIHRSYTRFFGKPRGRSDTGSCSLIALTATKQTFGAFITP